MTGRGPGKTGRGLAAALAALLALQAVAGCAFLPRSGPLAREIDPVEGGAETAGLVAPLTAELAVATRRPATQAFAPAIWRRSEIDPGRVGVGDVLEVLVWEASATPLLGAAGAGAATLGPARVDGAGSIYVPYAGQMRAAGLSLGELRERIRGALGGVTLDPQVDVRLVEPRSRLVTAQGSVQRPGPYVLDAGASRLTEVLALAGGSTLAPEQTEVAIRRGGETGSTTLADLYENPALDVALAPGDAIFLKAIRERFIVLGAASAQGEIQFPTRPLSLLSALGAARGLNDFAADPTGVFVFRWEDPAIADAALKEPRPAGIPEGPGRPIVYRLDLTEPQGPFIARAFEMRDGDAIFATNAPLTEVQKIASMFQAVFVPIQGAQRVDGF
jgi:polysaccharide export outer membrane protein